MSMAGWRPTRSCRFGESISFSLSLLQRLKDGRLVKRLDLTLAAFQRQKITASFEATLYVPHRELRSLGRF